MGCILQKVHSGYLKSHSIIPLRIFLRCLKGRILDIVTFFFCYKVDQSAFRKRYILFMDSRLEQTLSRSHACVHGSTNCTNGIPISFKVLPMVPLVIPLVPMIPLVKTVGSQYCRQSTVWAKLPTLESHMIRNGVLNFKFINFTNKH